MFGVRAPIRRYGSACLRTRACDADPAAPETRELARRLWRVLDTQDGVGLAAPQLGADRRVIVISEPVAGGARRRVTLINPVVRRTFGPAVPFAEGCLSFPGLYVRVMRPQGVEVEFDDPEQPAGRRTLRDQGLLARVVQHEIDHLEGVLFIDHLSPLQRLLLAPRLLLIAIRGWLGR